MKHWRDILKDLMGLRCGELSPEELILVATVSFTKSNTQWEPEEELKESLGAIWERMFRE